MRIFTSILLLASSFLSAQNHRFIYEYTFVKDSLNKDQTASEDMTLDITDKGSKYYSYEVYKADSMMQADLDKQMKMATSGSNISFRATSSFSKGSIQTVINKSYPDFTISQNERIGMNAYTVEDDRKIVWKILPETMKVGEFKAQKATTEMYGRKWIAWFSTELPFQDGPYKFHGLPGLIIKIEDATKSHVIELKGVNKLPFDYAISDKEERLGRNTITLNYPKYKKVFVENRNNPSSSMRQLQGSSTKFIMKDQNGNALDLNKMMRDQDEKAKENNKKNNNLLELDLLR